MKTEEKEKDVLQYMSSAMQNFSDHKHAMSCQLEDNAKEKMRELEEQVFKAFSLLNDAMMDNILPIHLFAEYMRIVKNVVEEIEKRVGVVCQETEKAIDLL